MSSRILRLFEIRTVRSAWMFLVGSVLMFLFQIYLFLAYPEQIASPPEELVSDVALFSAWFFATGSYIALASWALFSSAGRQHLLEQEARPEAHRQTGPVRLMMRLWRWLTVLVGGFVVFALLLMLIGSFTVEWTCQCRGPDHWECKGLTCQAEADAHFEKYKHAMNCRRTDWPMLILGGVGQLLLPK